jgi:hypothetical protein
MATMTQKYFQQNGEEKTLVPIEYPDNIWKKMSVGRPGIWGSVGFIAGT